MHVHCAPVHLHVAGHLAQQSLVFLAATAGGLTDQFAAVFLFKLWNNGHDFLYEWVSR